MRRVDDPLEIRQLMHDKQRLEIRLAFELLEIFNDPRKGLIGPLREMVAMSIDEMDKVARTFKYQNVFANKWIRSWRKYAVCTDNSIHLWRPDKIKRAARYFLAQDCADWIRIFGEVMEDVVGGSDDARRKGFQKGNAYHWTKFNQWTPGNQEDKGRRRVTESHLHRGAVLTDYQLEADNPYMNYRERQIRRLGAAPGPMLPMNPSSIPPVWGFMRDMTPSAGLNRWRVMEGDTVGKMDQVFGLMPGATISGTTSDNIYFFERFGGIGLDPIFYLLPTATIVAGGHHSLLEVALPLTLNGVGDYKVGLYSTLLPEGVQLRNRPAGVAAIRSALIMAENHIDNYLMLIDYHHQNPDGCLVYNNFRDKDKWRRMASGTDLMKEIKFMSPWPKREEVNFLALTLGLRD